MLSLEANEELKVTEFPAHAAVCTGLAILRTLLQSNRPKAQCCKDQSMT